MAVLIYATKVTETFVGIVFELERENDYIPLEEHFRELMPAILAEEYDQRYGNCLLVHSYLIKEKMVLGYHLGMDVTLDKYKCKK